MAPTHDSEAARAQRKQEIRASAGRRWRVMPCDDGCDQQDVSGAKKSAARFVYASAPSAGPRGLLSSLAMLAFRATGREHVCARRIILPKIYSSERIAVDFVAGHRRPPCF